MAHLMQHKRAKRIFVCTLMIMNIHFVILGQDVHMWGPIIRKLFSQS